MPSLRFIFLATLAATSRASVSVSFRPPSLIAASPALGVYADHAFALTPSTLFIQAGGFFESVDGGATWRASAGCASAPRSGGIDGSPVRLRDGSLRNFGAAAARVNATSFTSPNATIFSARAGAGGLACAEAAGANISFTGLPAPTACGPRPAFGCPFRLDGGGLVALGDGSLLYAAMVFWGAPDDRGIARTSLVAYGSTDGGTTWAFRGTIAQAASLPASQEGPNENSLSLLSDGATVACVLRLDAGDGPDTHPFAHSALRISRDGGATWEDRGALPTAGAARPRLLHLGADGRGGVAPAPLLLTGGRMRDPATNTSGWDILYWVCAAGDGEVFEGPHSLSAVHNALAPPAWRFSPALNDSAAPRQATSYTSILELDGGADPARASRELGLTYNRALEGAPNMLFFMPLTVAW